MKQLVKLDLKQYQVRVTDAYGEEDIHVYTNIEQAQIKYAELIAELATLKEQADGETIHEYDLELLEIVAQYRI